MCRMLGMIGTPPLPVRESLNAFYPLCTDGAVGYNMPKGHLDGWAFSGFSDQRAVYFERRAQAASGNKALYDQSVEKAARSKTPVLVAHFRKASAGSEDVSNTAPFHYRDWVFAHNGTIFNHSELPLQEARPQGQTDSERFGLWLMEQVVASFDPTPLIIEALGNIRPRLSFSSLNFLLSDGKTLWAYREAGNHRLEKGETLEDREKYFTLYTTRLERSHVVCSEPLSALAKNWTPITPKTLAVYSLEKNEPALHTL